MAPYGERRSASLADNVSAESSIASSFFRDIDTLKDSKDFGSAGTEDYDSFSVQTPSVNDDDESDGSFSVDTSALDSTTKAGSTIVTQSVAASSSVVTPSVVDIDNVSVSTPSVHSIGTPSVQDNDDLDDMDQSAFGSVIDSVIHSVVGDRNKKNADMLMEDDEEVYAREDSYYQTEEVSQVVEEQYDDFMNDYSNQSVDIMRKRSVGLAQVMSAIDQEEEDQLEYDDDETFTASLNSNKNDYIAEVVQRDDADIEKEYKKSLGLFGSSKSNKGSKSARAKSSKPLPSSFRSTEIAANKKSSGKNRLSTKESILGEEDASIAFSLDSSQPPFVNTVPGKTSRGKFAKVGNVTKEDLGRRRDIELLLSVKKYREMLGIIRDNPKVLAIQSNQPSGKTFLHVIANMPVPPPENVILKVVSVDTSLVGVKDNNNNTPLHYAAQHVRKGNMHTFMVFLKFHPMGASERNSDGDLPLHIVASNPMRGAEEAAHMLLETHPKAITEPNNKGKIPLHLALCEGSKNLKLLLKIIKLHKFRKSNVDVVDNRGEIKVFGQSPNAPNFQHRF